MMTRNAVDGTSVVDFQPLISGDQAALNGFAQRANTTVAQIASGSCTASAGEPEARLFQAPTWAVKADRQLDHPVPWASYTGAPVVLTGPDGEKFLSAYLHRIDEQGRPIQAELYLDSQDEGAVLPEQVEAFLARAEDWLDGVRGLVGQLRGIPTLTGGAGITFERHDMDRGAPAMYRLDRRTGRLRVAYDDTNLTESVRALAVLFGDLANSMSEVPGQSGDSADG